MGRFLKPGFKQYDETVPFSDTNSVFDADGYLTSYVANDITYTNIIYKDDEGVSRDFGGVYKKIVSWTETSNITGESNNITVTYAPTGRVSDVSVELNLS